MIHSRYSDKVVLITGGGGMGRAAALRIRRIRKSCFNGLFADSFKKSGARI